ncbi:MAG: response regulator [Cystobacterineae bacterium]|nr:response regulator [Cystobacterineae bacterium]
MASNSNEHSIQNILIVDDDPAVRDVLSVLLEEEGYPCTVAHEAEAALKMLENTPFSLVISDVKMPGKSGTWLLEKIRERHAGTPVIMLTALGEAELAVGCLRIGASDYLLKPPKITELVRSIERVQAKKSIELAQERYQRELEATVASRTRELQTALKNVNQSYQNTLLALVAALDAREQETSEHSLRVVAYALAIARQLELSSKELQIIGQGALLHDIGKIGVPDAVLLKPGQLTPEEWEQMRRHPLVGYQMIKPIPFLSEAAEIILSHHEHYDGTGYPHGRMAEEIPIGARIFAIADALDAMTRDRPYRKGMALSLALKEITRYAHQQFDPLVVKAFLSIGEKELLHLCNELHSKPLWHEALTDQLVNADFR